MKKTYLTETTILSVFDYKNNEKKLLGKMISGIVIKDDINRFSSGQRVITSTIETQEQYEYTTKSGNCYVTDDEPGNFEISFVEFVVMRHKLCSPEKIVEMRQALKLADDRIMH
mgnify:CR=1 FL=1